MSEQNSVSEKEMGTFEKIYNVFLAPSKTFQSIDRKPDWIIPMAIVLAVVLLVTIFIMPIVMPEKMAEQRAKMEEKGMSPEEIDRAVEMGESIGSKAGPVMGVVSTFIVLLIIAALLMFTCGIILGGEKTSFKKVLSVVSYTSLIGSLGSLILLPVILSKKTAEVGFNLASFMSSDASESFLYQLLKKVDLFMIWEIIVAGIGLAVIYKLTTKKTITAVALLYVIVVAIGLGLQNIF